MELLFIDESETHREGRKEYLILVGLSINENVALLVERELEDLKESVGLKNLKELRGVRDLG